MRGQDKSPMTPSHKHRVRHGQFGRAMTSFLLDGPVTSRAKFNGGQAVPGK